MKWRVVLDVTVADGAVRVHEIGGGAVVDEYPPGTIGPTVATAKVLLAGLRKVARLLHCGAAARRADFDGDH